MHRSLRRARRGPRAIALPAAIVSATWQQWIAQNILRGVEASELVDGLVDGGVPRALARRTVIAIASSPGLALARDQERRTLRLEQVLRLHASVREQATIERRPAPAAPELFGRYWATGTPAIFTDIVPRWRAQWTPENLRTRFANVRIEACTGRDGDTRPDANWREHRVELSLGEYVDRMLATGDGNDLYLIANNRNTARDELRALWDDVVLPPGWFDEPKLPYGSALWLGPAGTITPLHHDTSNILFCQIHGRKRIVLAPPWASTLLESADGVYNRRTIESLADEGVPTIDVVIEPGESLFIPVGWWHDVRALDASVSLAINAFARTNVYSEYAPGGVR